MLPNSPSLMLVKGSLHPHQLSLTDAGEGIIFILPNSPSLMLVKGSPSSSPTLSH